MKLYALTFSDPEQGFIVQWRRNQKQVAALLKDWGGSFPLRELVTQEYVEVPTDKTEFVEWLNANATRKPV